jgi:nucleolysin TIA-1/TIAR
MDRAGQDKMREERCRSMGKSSASSAGRLAVSRANVGDRRDGLSNVDVRTSIDAARKRQSMEMGQRGIDGRRSVEGVAIPAHDYCRSDASDEEAELNNINLPNSMSTQLFADGLAGKDGKDEQQRAGLLRIEDGDAGGVSEREERARVSTEENNLLSHLERSSSHSNISMKSGGRKSIDNMRRSNERDLRSSGDFRASGDMARRSSGGEYRRLSGSSRLSTESAESARIRSLSQSTLYLGNLHPYVNDVVLRGLFAGFDGIAELKVIKDRATGLSAGYGFARFLDIDHAALALEHIKNQSIFGQQIKANWALQKDKEDELGSHHHVFVGDLSPDVTDAVLLAAFADLNGCSDARVMWDHVTGRSKGYGFVSFVTKDQAERAIQVMDGAYIGMRCVRCGWAKHRTDTTLPADPNILDQTDPTNTNIYIGNLPGDLSNEQASEEFSKYGLVVEIKLHRKGNYGFVRYQTHAQAVDAIVGLNSGHSFNGRKLKCSWGRHPMVPPSGVKAQLIMAAATTGQLPQPGVMQPMPSSYIHPAPLQSYIMPTNLNVMGNMRDNMMGAPHVPLNRQPPVYPMGQMAQIPSMLQMDAVGTLGIDSVAENMARMGFYGNQMVLPQNHNTQVDHAMASGFYSSGSVAPSPSPRAFHGYSDDSRGGGQRGRRDDRHARDGKDKRVSTK